MICRTVRGHFNDVRLIDFLLAKEVEITDGCSNTLLHQAIALDDYALINLLLERSYTDLNAQNNYGNSPLHFAVMNNDTRIVTALIDKQAKLAIKNSNGQTATHIAAMVLSDLDVLDRLFDQHILDNKDNANNTPLHLLVRYNEEIAKELVKRWSDDRLRSICDAYQDNHDIVSLCLVELQNRRQCDKLTDSDDSHYHKASTFLFYGAIAATTTAILSTIYMSVR
ncbi:ankyrin repeat domain-containing protein [Thiotrichales bacterium 19S3-7]|nr:ankyrin repeat domain-containing protein [Thiotrichales bacterium 19S3-7]MCF6803049.1 ankyrin repeat domain-containing protein [Thiotrichales bacterium 19S3-11]